nr:hypothetical protein HmN_000519900 [Hymenolepis microstoma]
MTARFDDIMSYDRLSSTSTNSNEKDYVPDSEELFKRRYNMQLIYDVVKKMCETRCEVPFIFDPEHPCKLVDYPDRDEDGIRRWKEAIHYIRNPKAQSLKINPTPLTPEKSVKHINFHVSSTSLSECEGKSMNTMRFANNLISLLSKDPALYVCTMHILRDKLIRQPKSNDAPMNFEIDNVKKVNKVEKGNRESPIPTWIERLEHMASDVKAFKEPFTHLMPPHPKEIFQNLKGSVEDSVKSDHPKQYSQEENYLFDSSSQRSLFSSTLLTGRGDDDNVSQDLEEQARITYLLDKLAINSKREEMKKRDDMIPHTPSSRLSAEEYKMDTPLTAAYKASGLNICKTKRNQPSPHKAIFIDDSHKMNGELKRETSDSSPLRGYFGETNCASSSPQELGYQCPCYFEKYIDTTTNVEQLRKLYLKMRAKLQALRGSGSDQTNKGRRSISSSVVSNITDHGNSGMEGQFITKPPINVKVSKSNQRPERTAQEFIADAIAAARRSNGFLHGE